MMGLNLILVAAGVSAMAVCYGLFKLKQANNEIERVLQHNADLTAQNKTLSLQKATAETQIKNANTRQKNAETTLNATRSKLIDGLQQSDDLRD